MRGMEQSTNQSTTNNEIVGVDSAAISRSVLPAGSPPGRKRGYSRKERIHSLVFPCQLRETQSTHHEPKGEHQNETPQ